MRLGMLPGQKRLLDQAFKKARAFDNFRQRTRRQAAAIGLLGLFGTMAGYVAGRGKTRDGQSREPSSPEVDANTAPWLRELVDGSNEDLRRQAMHVLERLSTAPADDVLWVAYHRLIGIATADSTDETLRRMLTKVAARTDAPAHARAGAQLLTSTRR